MAPTGEATQLYLSVLPGDRTEVDSVLGWAELQRAARTFSKSRPPHLQRAAARALCREAILTFWSRLLNPPQHPPRRAPESEELPLGSDELALATALGQLAAKTSAEEASYFLGSTYAAMLPEADRARGGVFYTPPPLVEHLLDRATKHVDWSSARVVDPACGAGAFIGPSLRRMAGSLRHVNRKLALRSIAERLRGFEIDPFSAWMASVFFDVVMHEEIGYSDPSIEAISVCDSLSTEHKSEFDLVIGNPPYGRTKLDPERRSRFARSLFGHANLYSLFLDLAVDYAKPGGTIAYVTPTGFLCGEYFKNLRRLLGEAAPPREFHLLTERSGIFQDVLQETLLAVFKKHEEETELSQKSRKPSKVQVHLLELQANDTKSTFSSSTSLPIRKDRPWIVPRSESAAQLVRRLQAMPHRLADWGYRVSTGPLVWNRHKGQLCEEPGPGRYPLIWAEAVTPEGTFVFRALRRNHAPFFAVRSENDPAIVRRACVLLQRTTSKEQPRRLIAAELPKSFIDQHGAVVVENHLNMIVPASDNPLVSTEELARFLNSRFADDAFRCMSGTVAVSAYELAALPVPSPPELEDLLSAEAAMLSHL